MTSLRATALLLAALLVAGPAWAQRLPSTTVETGHPFEELVTRVKDAILDHDLLVVYAACASCAAQARGIEIPGNTVIGAFSNVFAVRMLEASVEAGIDAPIEFYVTEGEDGTASLTYRLPSDVFVPYDDPALDAIATELDHIWLKIVEEATAD